MNGTTASATAYRYITRHPGVRSGHAIVEGTRIGVHDVVGLLQNGETVDTLVAGAFRTSPVPRCTSASPTTKITGVRLTSWSPSKWPWMRREVSFRPRRP